MDTPAETIIRLLDMHNVKSEMQDIKEQQKARENAQPQQ